MQQLIMYWDNDGTAPKALNLDTGLTVVRLPDKENAVDEWLDIVQYGLTKNRMDEKYFQTCMVEHFDYDPNQCFFVMVNGVAAATVSVFVNEQSKKGYIHMVACKEEFRGRGIGTLLCDIVVRELKEKGMQSAYLTTDDFRIPAIKSYLRAGFYADESTDDFKVRWNEIRKVISDKSSDVKE